MKLNSLPQVHAISTTDQHCQLQTLSGFDDAADSEACLSPLGRSAVPATAVDQYVLAEW